MHLSEQYPGEMLPVRVIRLRENRYGGGCVILDPGDYEAAAPYPWAKYPTFNNASLYHICARIADQRRTMSLSMFLTGWGETGHANGNPFDCRRANLCQSSLRRPRPGSASPFKGVTRLRNGRFQARIVFRRECYFLGNYDDDKDAARAYDSKALKLIGPHAMTNERMGLL